jgi:hypothetical protein
MEPALLGFEQMIARFSQPGHEKHQRHLRRSNTETGATREFRNVNRASEGSDPGATGSARQRIDSGLEQRAYNGNDGTFDKFFHQDIEHLVGGQ